MAVLSPEEFDQWVAWSRIRPGDADRLAEILKTGFLFVCGALGRTIDVKMLDPLDPERALRRPARRRPGQLDETRYVSPRAAANWATVMIPGN